MPGSSGPSRRAVRDRQLRVLIRASHEGNRRRAYGGAPAQGSPRERHPYQSQAGHAADAGRGAQGPRPERFHSTTMSDDDQPIAGNVLDRQFVAERPNQRWVGDTTEFLIGSSAKLYLAAIMDLHSRFIVGWALSAVNDRHLTLSALDKALKRRFSTVKSEEAERFESYAHAKEALFDYIEVFYNQRRRHSTLGQISPAEFERRFNAA